MKKNYTNFLQTVFSLSASLSFFLFLNLSSILAQSAGDYRTAASGLWGNVAIWESYDGLAWVAASASPTATDGVINIQAAHNVNVSSNTLIDQTVVDGGLTVDVGAMLEVQDDGVTATNDLLVTGTMLVNGTLRKNEGAKISSTTTTLTINAAATYEHNNTITIGNLPLATWNPASTCSFIGYTATVGGIFAANNFAQNFGNFTWNCPNQTSNINLAGNLTVVNGSFHVVSTGTGQLRLCGATSPTLSISNDFILDNGELVLTNGTGLPVINLNGNYIHNGGSLLCNPSSTNIAAFNFVKNGIQQITINPSAFQAGEIAFAVKNSGGFGPSTLEFTDAVSELKNDTSTASFSLESGTKLIIRHPQGIALTGTTGCIQTGTTRTFAADADYHYVGTQPQITGTGLPTTLNASLEINNTSPVSTPSVSLSQATLMTGATSTLLLTQGKFVTSNTNLLSLNSDVNLVGGSAFAYIEGPLQRFTNSTSPWFFPLGDGIYFKPVNMNPQSATAANFTVTAHHQTPPSNTSVGGASNTDICSLSGVEYWEVTGSAPAQIQLFWHSYSGIDEVAQVLCPSLVVAHLNNTSALWQSIGNFQTDFTQDYIISTYTGNFATSNHTFGFLCTVKATATTITQPSCGNNNGAINVTTSNGTGIYTYSWYDGVATEDRTNLGAGTYTLVVTDGGCTDTLVVTLNPSTGLSTSASLTQPTCGANNGAIDVSVLGGTGTLTYTWSNNANTQDILGLAAGTYIVIVKDAALCADTLSNTLNNIGGINAVNDTIVVCPGASSTVIPVLNNDTGTIITNSLTISTPPAVGTGTASVNANGTISFTSGTSFGASTIFSYQVSDGTGCSDIATVLVVNGAAASPTITPSGATTFCQGDSVTLTSNSPIGNLWGPGGQTTQSITVYASGTYGLTVSNGTCSAVAIPVTVTVNTTTTAPSVTVSGPINFCQGDSVTLTSSVAAGITWSPGGQTTQSITVYNSGSYTVTLGASGCSGTSSPVNVNVLPTPATPTISANGPTTFCQGGNVVLTSSSANGNSWLPGVQTTQAITVTTSGTYTVTVTNASGCSATSAPTNVVINAVPPTPIITPLGSVTVCAGDTVILTTNAVSPFQWSNGQTSSSITVLAGGNYTVTVPNANGCPATSAITSVTVNPLPAAPIITPSGPTTFCQGNPITLSSSYATGNIWSNLATSQAIIVGSTGSYSVTYTDANGCSSVSAPTLITVNPAPATPLITASGATTFCAGDSITLTSSATSANVWSPSNQTTQSITVSTAGSYTVTITGANGCTATSAPTLISVNPLPAAPIIAVSGATTFCAGGSVTLSSNSVNGNLWNTGQGTQAINVTSSGNYTVSITDNLGCTGTSAPIAVTVNPLPSAPTITANGPLSLCANDSVSLISSATTGNTWSSGANTQFITVNTAGTYTLFVTDANGCASPSSSVIVTQLPALAANAFTVTQAGCNAATGSASVSVIGGSGAYNYVWNANPIQTTQTATGLVGGTYIVTVSDASNSNCFTIASTLVQGGVTPNVSVAPSGTIPFCEGKSIPLTALGANSYIWLKDGISTGTGSILIATEGGSYQAIGFSGPNATGCPDTSVTIILNQINKPQIDIMPIGPTEVCYEHLVTLVGIGSDVTTYMWLLNNQNMNNFNDTVVTAIKGNYSVVATNVCGSDTSAVVFVNVHSKPDADFIYTPDPAIAGMLTQFKDKSVNASTWLWDFADGTNTSTVQNPIHTYLNSGTYDVELIIADNIGCKDTIVKPVIVIDKDVNGTGAATFIPNTFTPNNDNAHDVLEIQYGRTKLTSLQIYDRWGMCVFETESPTTFWNGGKQNNLGKPCEPGTYFYVIAGKDAKEDKILLKGSILLMR